MARVFISYRRQDSNHVVGRIYDKLISIFGFENVFKDVDSIPLGNDFRSVINNAVKQCTAVVAVIGTTWLESQDQNGIPRLDSPSDFLRIELETAIEANIRIIPALIDGAALPDELALPKSLRPLSFRNAAVIRSDPNFHRDMERLVEAIGRPTQQKTNMIVDDIDSLNLHPRIDAKYQLRVVAGTITGEVFQIRQSHISIGRAPHNDVILTGDSYCSRTECYIDYDIASDSFILDAFGISIAVNELYIGHGKIKLKVGDRIRVGSAEMLFETIEEDV
jgi:hypothetical protein